VSTVQSAIRSSAACGPSDARDSIGGSRTGDSGRKRSWWNGEGAPNGAAAWSVAHFSRAVSYGIAVALG
jgi:hypothetical protein